MVGGNQNLDVYERPKKQVSGPKNNIANCPYCNMPAPAGLLDDHIKNAHIDPLAELIKKSEIFLVNRI